MGGVYIFKVALEGDKKIWRRIAIRGGQTLHDLHEAIYTAFDRDDEHLYSFYLAPKSVTTSSRRKLLQAATEYTCPYNTESPFDMDEDSESAAKTKIESLMLSVGRKLFYLFDFGDNWWHELTVEQVDGKADSDKYPRVIEKHGGSPPQYPEWDDQDEEFLEENH
jgi:hypothetical protein